MVASPEYRSYKKGQKRLFVSPTIKGPFKDTPYAPDPRLQFNKRNIQEWTAVYYGLIQEVSDYLAIVLDELKNLGLEDNTLVIFTSDHGEQVSNARCMHCRTDAHLT